MTRIAPCLVWAFSLSLVLHSEALDACEKAPTYTQWKCKPGHDVACWSKVPSAQWVCFKPDFAAQWKDSPSDADKVCQETEMPPGLGPQFYDAACKLPNAPRDTLAVITTPAPAAAPAQPGLLPAQASSSPITPLSWDDAYKRAEATLAELSTQDKYSLMRGIGYDTSNWWAVNEWYYVGNTAPIPDAKVPSLNMQDASGGFHTTFTELAGTATCWPSMLAAAATWDPGAVEELAKAVGEEFAGKGANVILGPGVDVSRVARNGRNFEYLSGEDPYLGSVLAKAYVTGVQSQGVAAVMKHWVFNVQETNRGSESSVVDDKTAWELYYPPFQAAVDAGVSGAMCSYNKVDGEYSCSNNDSLQKVLKGTMGFKGFVQSDWWAVHDMSAGKGLDQEMPGVGEHVYFDDDALSDQDDGVVDEAVTRVLAVMHRLNMTQNLKCTPPDCEETMRRNVSSEAHTSLARKLATESVIMLKNRGSVLPLSGKTIKTISVVGAAAVATPFNPQGDSQDHGDWSTGDYYSGGGSGHVVATYVINAFDGISARAKAEGIEVVPSLTNDVDQAVDAAKKVDVTIVVAATTSGESKDRASLNLDDGADELIDAVAKVSNSTVVLVQAPGAVVMPWHDSVASILTLFLGGQETGSAWGSVLFGDHAPTGRLPLMIPESEDDTVAPADGEEIVYSEGLKTSYRNPDVKPVFPFGHGITYSTFKYSAPTSGPCTGITDVGQQSVLCIHTAIQNEGKVAARSVPQLYLEFPGAAGHPAPFLKGFRRTELLEAGAEETVTFSLSTRDLSFYDAEAGEWTPVSEAQAHIGESSADIRQTLGLSSLAASTRSDPYDCEAGYSNWAAGWSNGKKEWCCINANMGCEVGRSDPYDCAAGYSNWEAGWSDGKKKWCCTNREVGCEASATEVRYLVDGNAAPAKQGGFCCFGAGNKSGCPTCAPVAKAASDSVCGMSPDDCTACGGGATWCEANASTFSGSELTA